MKFKDVYFSKTNRYSIGLESENEQYYISIPVTNGVVDYEEYYRIDSRQYQEFLNDSAAAAAFAESCRRHERDGLLMQTPGANRGTPV